MFEQFDDFITKTLEEVKAVGINVTGLEIDHIARTTSSKPEYDQLRPELLELGRLVAEDLVGGRRVAIVELTKPLSHGEYSIPGVELIEPVVGTETSSGLNHVEFVLPMGYKQFMDAHPEVAWDTTSLNREEYPHLKVKTLPAVKFHEMTIFETVEHQHSKRKETK